MTFSPVSSSPSDIYARDYSPSPDRGSSVLHDIDKPHSNVQDAADAGYAKSPNFSLEILDNIISFTDPFTAENCALLCRHLVPSGRKYMLRNVVLDYKNNYGEPTKSERLLALLDADPRCAKYIRHVEVYDLARSLKAMLALEQGGTYDEEFEDLAVTTVMRARHALSPGAFFHDDAAAQILRRLVNVESVVLQFKYYLFDWTLYFLHHGDVLVRLSDLPSMTSFKMRGVSNFPLAQLDRMRSLKTLSIWSCSFMTMGERATSGDANEGNGHKAYLDNCNMANVLDPEGNFLRYITDNGSTIDFSRVQNLVVDIRNAEDINCIGRVMDLAAESLDHFELSTKHIYTRTDTVTVGTPFTPMDLSKLKFIRSLCLRLNFRPKLGINEIEWFLQNIELLPCGNHLEDLEIILDMAHDSDACDRQDLAEYEEWPQWEDIFLSQNLAGLHKLRIVISSAYQEYNYRMVYPRDSIRLPRLVEKMGWALVFGEMWDTTVKHTHFPSSFQM